jgi:peptide/nickel transport system substrate-binding protein
VAEVSAETDKRLDRFVLRRIARLVTVRRFVVMWLLLVIVSIVGVFLQLQQLTPHYQEVRAVPGGTYREGVLGSFTNANPLYASGSVDGAVSKLVFSSLYTFDRFNQLVPDLATGYEVDDTGLEYIVSLREDVYWHDGEPFTADDVVFTYETIGNPDARSPMFSSWTETDVSVVDEHTVKFELPSPYVTFPLALTNGIVPEHILADVSPRQLRSDSFNTAQPIGTGPFMWDTIEVVGATSEDREERIALNAYEDYHRGRPNLDRFVLRTFRSESRMIESFINRDVYAIVGINNVSHEMLEDYDHHKYVVPLSGQVGVFFKQSESVFSERTVRQALVRYIDTEEVLRSLEGAVRPSDGPLLSIHQGYDESLTQLEHDPERATEQLADADWELNDDGIWQKDEVELSFSLVALNSADARAVTSSLQEQWHQHGVRVDVTLQDESELSRSIANHEFMALLHGIAIGTDPDVYAFWHSSQAEVLAENRLNFSDYQSSQADEALESGRTRSDDELRSVKYQPFLEAWRRDAPALMLYKPRFIYITQSEVSGFEPIMLNSSSDRMFSAHEWYIRRGLVDRIEPSQ